jgi:electron transport complex protein RnfG
MVGFDTKGTILNVNVLEQAETPGLGAKMTEEGNPLLASIQGKEAAKTKLTVKKDGGDVDALTAATISSRAYAEAVARAYSVFKVVAGWEREVQATTGASQTKKEE